MNASNMNNDANANAILDQYRSISSKLKKRFLRKPNVTEACEAFTSLGQFCENEEMPAYAGLCWIAAAQCEGSLSNVQGETACLRRSARQFLAAESKCAALGCPTPSSECLNAALSCYAHAITRYPSSSVMTSVNINLEIVEALKRGQHTDKYELFIKNALTSSSCSVDTRLLCLEHLATFYMKQGEFVSALDTFSEMKSLMESVATNAVLCDMQLMCEINRVLLLLILKPIPSSLSADMGNVLEKYTWNAKVDRSLTMIGMNASLFLLLQSLVLSCQARDAACLAQLESELWVYFNTEQKELLRVILQMH